MQARTPAVPVRDRLMTNSIPFKVDHLSFSYDSHLVIQDITFTVDTGDFVGIIGPNGSGKSTLLKLMLGLLRPQSGSVEVFGKPAPEFNQWQRIGYVSQRVTHFDVGFPATVREVVAQGRVARAGLLRSLKKNDNDAIAASLEDVDIAGLKDRSIGELSGGQQQRVFIARALAQNPEVLVLDEPTMGIDPDAHHRFFEVMRDLHDRKGLTIVMVSHEVDVLMTEVTKLVCVNRSLLFHGTPEQCVKDNCLIDLYGEGFHRVEHRHPWLTRE